MWKLKYSGNALPLTVGKQAAISPPKLHVDPAPQRSVKARPKKRSARTCAAVENDVRDDDAKPTEPKYVDIYDEDNPEVMMERAKWHYSNAKRNPGPQNCRIDHWPGHCVVENINDETKFACPYCIGGDENQIARVAAGKKKQSTILVCANKNSEQCELMDFSADMWTDSRVVEVFSSHRGVFPPLVRVEEMHVRLKGNHKFRCVFKNNMDHECIVWVSDVLIFRNYNEQYLAAKQLFTNAVAR